MKNWIVVVDDEAMSLTSARTLLASEDMKISCLSSGADLLFFLNKNNPDLILLDIMMPALDGFETFEALRKQEKEQNKPEIPVIFLTGDSDEETERRGLKLGAADYIHKPFNKDILVSRIKNTINNSKQLESLRKDATKDGLTGFLNKAEGSVRVKESLLSLSGSLLVLDLDSFKLVNDLFGHEKGDQILKAFADLARRNTRTGDILCRIGGDEFLFFCCGLSKVSALSGFIARLNRQFEEEAKRLLGAEHGIPLGISAGAVMVPEYGTDYDSLFKMADEAMYQAKKNGKHRCSVYEDSEASYDLIETPDEELARITKIIAERTQGREALILGTEAFSTIFHFVERYNSAHDSKALILLFILTAKKAVDETVFNDAYASFGEVLKKVLGKSDIILQYKNNQYLVLIPGISDSNAGSVVTGIISEWNDVPGCVDFEIKTASQIR